MRVKSIMTKEVHVAKVPGNRHDLLKAFREHHVSGLPVVRRDNSKLVGLVTSKDLFRRSNEEQIAMIMNKNPITCAPNTELQRAVRLMVENHIHRLIVKQNDEVKGILTPHDILPVVMKEEIDTPVMDLIKRRCVPVYQETPLFIVWRILKISQSYALPIIGDQGELTGIITDRDIFGLSTVGHKSRTSPIGVGDDEDIWTWESLKNVMKLHYEVSDIDLPDEPVRNYMMAEPTTVFLRTKAHMAAKKMYENNFRILPIIDNNENLVNTLSDLDVISILYQETRSSGRRYELSKNKKKGKK